MPNAPKPPRGDSPSPKTITEDDLVEVWFALFNAHVLISIATELEDDERYVERAMVLLKRSSAEVDDALTLLEEVLGTGRSRRRPDRRLGHWSGRP